MSELSTQETLSRKEREKRMRQQEILKAARELFVSKGYRETTLEEIAHQAEFGKGTLYNYFTNKDEIFHAIIDQSIEETIGIAREAAASKGGIREKLTSFALQTIRYVKENGELLHIIYHELHRSATPENRPKVHDMFRRAHSVWGSLGGILQEGIDAGVVRRRDPLQYVVLFDGMVRGYCFKAFTIDTAPSEVDIAAAADMIVSVFLDGITEKNQRTTL